LLADEVTDVGTRVAGRVAEVLVDLGDRVEAGQPLARLDVTDAQLQITQAEAQLLQARSAVGLLEGEPVSKLNPENAPPVRQERALWEEAKMRLERTQSLAADNAISSSELETIVAAERVAEARYSASLNSVREKIALIYVREAELAVIRQQVADATIRAPYAGQIQQRAVSPGAFVNVGSTIATLVRTDVLRYRGALPERFAKRLAIGQDVTLNIESIAAPRNVKVTRISPMLDPLTRSLTFEAVVDNSAGELRTGLFAEASVTIDPQSKAIVIPISAAIQFAGAEKVWLVLEGVTQEREVFLGTRRGDQVEVLEGLSPGDVILRDAKLGRIARVTSATSEGT
jgi:RND family efflux transporter MFP subunit